jgi:predicted TPR repeat methyltransferase
VAQKNIPAAINIFKLNVALYPQSANAYDSLAETQESTNQASEALSNYRKSLSLNLQNKHAADRIKALEAK